MIKAVKEAKLHTSWLTPNQGYETAVTTFVEAVLTDPRFLESFLRFQSRVAVSGMVNSLAQVTLKLGCPGVADFYQGNELWDQSLVDPDNRRPVDFERRRQMLAGSIGCSCWMSLSARRQSRNGSGRGRMAGSARCHGRRRGSVAKRPDLFLSGEYLPLVTESTVGASIVAFARMHGDSIALFVAPRFSASLIDDQHPMPLGVERWKTTRVLLPASMTDRASAMC